MKLRLISSRPILIANIVTAAVGLTWFAVPGLVARLLQTQDGYDAGYGLSMVVTSLLIVPMGLSVLLFNRWARRHVARHGARHVLRTGSLLTVVAYAVGLVDVDLPWLFAVVAALVGVGTLLIMCAVPLILFDHVDPSSSASASSFNAVMRWVGSALSSATIGAILAVGAVSHQGVLVPNDASYAVSFALVSGVGVLGSILSSLLPRPASRRDL